MNFRNITTDDLLGRIRPGSTVYKDKNTPLVVEDVHWFGDYALDIISCNNGRSYPATDLLIAV